MVAVVKYRDTTIGSIYFRDKKVLGLKKEQRAGLYNNVEVNFGI